MDTFYIEPERFWEIFNSNDDTVDTGRYPKQRYRLQPDNNVDSNESYKTGHVKQDLYGKRMKTIEQKQPRVITETDAASRADARFIIMWARYKPGKKNKVWEGDGYLTLVGQMAHLSDLRGRMLEDPTILDDIDYKSVEDLGDLVIGGTEVQVVERDKT